MMCIDFHELQVWAGVLIGVSLPLLGYLYTNSFEDDIHGLWQEKTWVWSMLQTERSQRAVSVILGHRSRLAPRQSMDLGGFSEKPHDRSTLPTPSKRVPQP